MLRISTIGQAGHIFSNDAIRDIAHCYILTYKLIQHYAHITAKIYKYRKATFRHVSVEATATIIRVDNSTDQKNTAISSYLVIHTDL